MGPSAVEMELRAAGRSCQSSSPTPLLPSHSVRPGARPDGDVCAGYARYRPFPNNKRCTVRRGVGVR